MMFSGIKPVVKTKKQAMRHSSWVELQDEDGRKYFSNEKRKQSTFTLPVGVLAPKKGEKKTKHVAKLQKGTALQAPVPFQPGDHVYLPDKQHVCLPAVVTGDSFCPGEEGTLLLDDGRGTFSKLRAAAKQETALMTIMNTQVNDENIEDIIQVGYLVASSFLSFVILCSFIYNVTARSTY